MKNENWILHISIELMRKIIFSSSSDNLNSIIYRSLFFILSNQILSPRSSFVNLIYEVISSWLFSFVSLIFFFFFSFFSFFLFAITLSLNWYSWIFVYDGIFVPSSIFPLDIGPLEKRKGDVRHFLSLYRGDLEECIR